MTRPATLAEAVERLAEGAPRDVALAEFLDAFYLATMPELRLEMLLAAPPFTGDARTDALIGAIGEYLAKQFMLAAVPSWVGDRRRVLAEPWFTTPDGADSDAMREYLSVSSPAEFIHHNIFTEPMPLRRASDPRARSMAEKSNANAG